MNKFQKFLNRNKRYELRKTEDGLNILVETEASKARTEKNRFLISLVFSICSTLAAIIAAVFAILAYIEP